MTDGDTAAEHGPLEALDLDTPVEEYPSRADLVVDIGTMGAALGVAVERNGDTTAELPPVEELEARLDELLADYRRRREMERIVEEMVSSLNRLHAEGALKSAPDDVLHELLTFVEEEGR